MKLQASSFLSQNRDWIAYILLAVVAVVLPLLTVLVGVDATLLIIVFLVGIPLAIYLITDLRLGVVVIIIFSFFLARLGYFFIKNFPLGTVIDILLLLLVLGLIFRKFQNNDLKLWKGAISFFVWVWIVLTFAELFNPRQSPEAWAYAIRSMAGHLVFYFIVLEVLDFKFFKKLLALWIVLALLGALYGLFQEFHGLLEVEKNWIVNDPERFKLYFNWGRFRIFSFFNDPTVFGILMVATSVLCLTLANIKTITLNFKVALLFTAGITLLGSVYSGTRTAYVMFPAGLFFYTLITFRAKILIAVTVIAVAGSAIIFSDIKSVGPFISTSSLERIRSAFRPSDDPSYQVREANQELIKPFIQNNPIGSGIGSIGVWGRRFNPNSELANFAPDSGYVRVGVELGWVGLIIYVLWLGTILIVGIRSYFKLRNIELKMYLAGILAVIYAFIVANYPQQAIIQLPSNFIFYFLMAAVVKIPTFEISKTNKL